MSVKSIKDIQIIVTHLCGIQGATDPMVRHAKPELLLCGTFLGGGQRQCSFSSTGIAYCKLWCDLWWVNGLYKQCRFHVRISINSRVSQTYDIKLISYSDNMLLVLDWDWHFGLSCRQDPGNLWVWVSYTNYGQYGKTHTYTVREPQAMISTV